MADRLLHVRTSDPVCLRGNGLWITTLGAGAMVHVVRGMPGLCCFLRVTHAVVFKGRSVNQDVMLTVLDLMLADDLMR